MLKAQKEIRPDAATSDRNLEPPVKPGVVTGLGDQSFVRPYRKIYPYSRQLQLFSMKYNDCPR